MPGFYRLGASPADIPSAAVIESEGLSLAKTQTLMMQKIEELMLYTIKQEKRINELETQNEQFLQQHRAIEAQKSEMWELKQMIQTLLKNK